MRLARDPRALQDQLDFDVSGDDTQGPARCDASVRGLRDGHAWCERGGRPSDRSDADNHTRPARRATQPLERRVRLPMRRPQIRRDSFFSRRGAGAFRDSASQNVARKCHSDWIGFTISEFAQEKPRDLKNGLRRIRSRLSCRYSSVEVFEMIDVLSECDPGSELGWEAGSLYRRFGKPQ